MARQPRFVPDDSLERRVSGLRLRGQDGHAIPTHRSIWRFELPPTRLAAGAALAVALTGGLYALRDLVAEGWAAVLVGWLNALGLPGRFDTAPQGDGSWFGLALASIDLQPAPQPPWALLGHAAVVAATWWLAGRLSDALRPATYLLRFAALIHGVAVAFFALHATGFPHTLVGHVEAGLRQTWGLMLITPSLHLLAYYLFPFSLWQHLTLTSLTMAWLGVAAPLLYALHAALLHHLGLVVMPLLQLLLGVMVLIVGFVALYGWAMSWPDTAGDRRDPAAVPRSAGSAGG